MEEEDLFGELTDAVVAGDKDRCRGLAEQALDEGLDPYKALMEGCAEGMNIMSDRYDEGEAYVPDILLSAEALYEAMDVLKPHIDVEDTGVSGKVLLGVVEGDIHDIGKNVLKSIFDAAGFDVIDLGRDVRPEQFQETIEKEKPDILGLSALMTTSMTGMPKIIENLQKAGLREKVKVMVGGAPISEDYAEKIGADGYAPNAPQAKKTAEKLLKQKKKEA
ncbi:MAG: Trimethylamine corrinoid protein MtbC1 [Candidatus Methanohalarchaeum thermophilum]|uniref:Trimethylamine corrinoid protein MtbC1 n=1 Tax=Methanohalarchaeum thermophilum TaxID=1903181 RepID=A0A1Q6DWE1_METT1|nr:MAG: Trimethylamine corrinoid protein MtbC1 [Candidatus Methanohalarchaeum thermophilum]